MSAKEWAEKAQALQAEEKYADAAKAYEEVIKLAPNIAEAWLNRGVCLSTMSKESEALKCFDKAIEIKPDLAAAHVNRANVYKASGKPRDAVVSYQEALRLDPSIQPAWYGLAHVLNETGDHEEAIKAAGKSIELLGGKVHAPSYNERVFAFLKLDRGLEALPDVEVLLKETPMEKADLNARQLYAIVFSMKAIQFFSEGNFKDALPMHQRSVEADPNFKNVFNYGIAQVKNGQDAEALKTLQRAKSIDPNVFKTYAAMGSIYVRQNDFANAAETYIAASKFKEGETDETVQFNAGVALMNLGRDPEAIPFMEKASKINPKNFPALNLLGSLYIDQKKYKEAQAILEAAAKLPEGEKHASLWYNLGYVQLMLENKAGALSGFKQAMALDPSSTQAKSAVQALEGSPEQIKKDLDNLPQDQRLDAAAQKEFDAVQNDPMARAKIIVRTQRPSYIRRKSMEGIIVGRVAELTELFTTMGTKTKR